MFLCVITMLTLSGAHGVERRKCVCGYLYMLALCWIFLCTVWGFRHCVGCTIPNYCVKYFILCCPSIINLIVPVVSFVYAELL